MNFKQWLEDAGLTHDDYVNKGPYAARGLKSKYRTKEAETSDEKDEIENRKMRKRLHRFGDIDPKLR